MRLYKQAAVSLGVLAVGAGAWLLLAPDGRALLASAGLVENTASEAPRTPGGGGRGGFGGAGIAVVTAPVTTGTLNDELSAIGDGEAEQTVTLKPEEAGTITEILIGSGEEVEKGEVLVRLDNREQTLARDQAKVALESAARQAQVNRKIKSSISETEVYNAEIAEKSAELDLQNAELALSRREIVAPISGVAGIVDANVGDYVTTTSEIVTIDDRSSILVDFAVPERFAASVKAGQAVEASLVSAPQMRFDGEVSAVDNRIDAASRTFMVRASIANDDDALRAGMSFEVNMHFPGDQYPGVDPLAVQWDSTGSFVWQLVDGKATKQRVRIIQRNPDVVLVDAELKPGDMVITEGIQRLSEGVAVTPANSAATEEMAGAGGTRS
ncbi:efflux RND transporter periplasmic adaptor subunit [Martelella endophytica]|uniref:Secretion protein HylD n=1 Tax=Martelella endophytica TaxID=1486262 RepID=A0A0D5LU19_MAREN|nr:efflux RND transporter periplasmic adaptor subunit [Martelella endophytica]AJY47460.1 secretion protein HylD [Martelella endophytica]